ncbi:CAP domain-containing protein [Tumebacillus sp. DT12]|uniref:CAP domain-containing protein n=1 Tax=Tumebacillus lacus TaxID=2995335 RepID=A0ABT3WZ01_9BACL|nr:CAP domain-containing protein [Tumebacillus lacus]MCX7569893.1 CAP domain-containing protein [Tumebacillus lacus]
MKKWITGCLTSLVLGASLLLPSFATPAHAESSTVYTVQRGDSVWKIAVRYHVGVAEIATANHLKNPNLIYPGQKLVIPLLDPKVDEFQNRVVQLTNAERAKHGLRPLKLNWELQRVARIKSEDMRNKNYFDHTSPTFGSPFAMMKNFGIQYSTAGENIAAGQTTPEAVVKSWMNSPGHRANILKAEYTQIGCGVAFGGSYRYYWTQQFIRP